MNQILNINLKNEIDGLSLKHNSISLNKSTNWKFFRIQLILSIIAIFIFISFYSYYKITLNNREKFSTSLINNYNISKLYNSQTNSSANDSYTSNFITNSTSTSNKENLSKNLVIGLIEIPKLNLFYPIFSQLNDELLKVSPCKFSGEMPEANSNLCIAGHNYNNDKFFSHISSLGNNDEIIIHDNFGNTFHYSVFKNYEVKENDLSPIYDKFTDSYELTLITCNNFNDNRIIIKAKKKVI